MRTCLALLLALSAVLPAVGAGHHQTQQRAGLVIESIDIGSAALLAGLRTGDELVSWTRVVPTSTKPVATGEFRTPFDARVFEGEHLPRGGTSVVAIHDGARIEVSLIPGFWGISVRPAFAAGDLAIYESGQMLLKDAPQEAATKWQPLIDQWLRAGDRASAGWLVTRVATSLVALGQFDAADDIFERAASLFKLPQRPDFEAMVWEAKGRAYNPELTRPINNAQLRAQFTERHIKSALSAHSRALALRHGPGQGTLLAAESSLDLASTGVRGINAYIELHPNSSPAEQRDWQEFRSVLDRARTEIAGQAPNSYAHARALLRWTSFVSYDFGPLSASTRTQPQAGKLCEPFLFDAWRILDDVGPTSRLLGSVLSLLSDIRMSDSAGSEDIYRRQIKLFDQRGDREQIVLPTMRLVSVLAKRGASDEAVALKDGLLAAGTEYPAVAKFLPGLAMTLGSHGRTEQAIGMLQEVLRRLSPEANASDYAFAAMDLVSLYNGIGDVEGRRRTLDDVILRVDLSKLPQSTQASILEKLARVALEQEDLTTAEAAAARWRALEEDFARIPVPARFDLLAGSADLLSVIAAKRGDRDKAREWLQRAIDADEKTEHPTSSQQYTHLNRLLRATDYVESDPKQAAELATRALELARQALPGTSSEANALENMAATFSRAGNPSRALQFARDALAIRRRISPQTRALAILLDKIGSYERSTGDRQAAMADLEEAVSIIESQRQRQDSQGASWGGAVAADPAFIYSHWIGLLVEDGQVARAFDVTERSRGRAMLELITQRGLRDSASIPQPLRAQRDQLESAYDAKQAAIEKISTVRNEQALDKSLLELQTIKLQLDAVDHQISEADPRLAGLERAVPLTVAQARARLDPGTVLLMYSAGLGPKFLFVLTPSDPNAPDDTGLKVYPLVVLDQDLDTAVVSFRNLLRWDADPTTAERTELLNRGKGLYDLLIRPAEQQIASAKRVLISAEGPLLALPFGALVRDAGSGSPPQYLIEMKPLHTTISMSLYAGTQRVARNGPGTFVAFADPVYQSGTGATTDSELEATLRSGDALAPLPGTRREVASIANLFAPGVATYIGEAATESRARALDASVRYVHFAVHGILNEKMPLNSELVLSMPVNPGPGENNGVLQAWEVFEHLRLDADLVTLSACDTGRGQAVTGEGLVGLTRAFLFAGARTVSASLWKVADAPTADLMTRFYRYLRDGQSKDQALRNAQLDLIHTAKAGSKTPDFSSPAYWGAFMLTGDWK